MSTHHHSGISGLSKIFCGVGVLATVGTLASLCFPAWQSQAVPPPPPGSEGTPNLAPLESRRMASVRPWLNSVVLAVATDWKTFVVEL
jgi:hypothetical protein